MLLIDILVINNHRRNQKERTQPKNKNLEAEAEAEKKQEARRRSRQEKKKKKKKKERKEERQKKEENNYRFRLRLGREMYSQHPDPRFPGHTDDGAKSENAHPGRTVLLQGSMFGRQKPTQTSSLQTCLTNRDIVEPPTCARPHQVQAGTVSADLTETATQRRHGLSSNLVVPAENQRTRTPWSLPARQNQPPGPEDPNDLTNLLQCAGCVKYYKVERLLNKHYASSHGSPAARLRAFGLGTTTDGALVRCRLCIRHFKTPLGLLCHYQTKHGVACLAEADRPVLDTRHGTEPVPSPAEYKDGHGWGRDELGVPFGPTQPKAESAAEISQGLICPSPALNTSFPLGTSSSTRMVSTLTSSLATSTFNIQAEDIDWDRWNATVDKTEPNPLDTNKHFDRPEWGYDDSPNAMFDFALNGQKMLSTGEKSPPLQHFHTPSSGVFADYSSPSATNVASLDTLSRSTHHTSLGQVAAQKPSDFLVDHKHDYSDLNTHEKDPSSSARKTEMSPPLNLSSSSCSSATLDHIHSPVAALQSPTKDQELEENREAADSGNETSGPSQWETPNFDQWETYTGETADEVCSEQWSLEFFEMERVEWDRY
jgi:hypothetical protein